MQRSIDTQKNELFRVTSFLLEESKNGLLTLIMQSNGEDLLSATYCHSQIDEGLEEGYYLNREVGLGGILFCPTNDFEGHYLGTLDKAKSTMREVFKKWINGWIH
jgi:hypothetical protein